MKHNGQDEGDIRLHKQIKILKTGLYNVGRYLDMTQPENLLYFEKLAVPGTELVLKREPVPGKPFNINVYSQEGYLLGRMTDNKCQTTARLMDAGIPIIAIVGESLPFHDSDYNFGITETADDPGWSTVSRSQTGHFLCNLPYGVYMDDEWGDDHE